MESSIDQYLHLLVQHRYRGVVLLVGSDSFHLTITNKLNSSYVKSNESKVTRQNAAEVSVLPSYILNDFQVFSGNVTEKNFRSLLGTESQSFIYASHNIQPDLFAALAGTVVAGGLLIICWHSLPNETSDNYLQRFYRELMCDEFLVTITESELLSRCQYDKLSLVNTQTAYSNINHVMVKLDKYHTNNTSDVKAVGAQKNNIVTLEDNNYQTITDEQQYAIAAIIKVVKGRRKRPVMITADRGRGKTTALALACMQLLTASERPLRIIITAPCYSSIAGFFQTLQSQLIPEKNAKTLTSSEPFLYQAHRIEFLPLDVILAKKQSVDLLLVDEAAALPLYLLTRLFTDYHRIVFSSTLHGYEGAGRGFALKFNEFVETAKIPLNIIKLEQPIRWGKNDPLECLVFNTCLLNAELPILSEFPAFDLNNEMVNKNNISAHISGENQLTIQTKQIVYQQYSVEMLLASETLLSKVFSILVTAHYQTSPNDLKLLLNNPLLSVFVLQYKDSQQTDNVEILAVAMVMQEGVLERSNNIANAISVHDIETGKRRAKNQFLPQSLLTHCGAKTAFDFVYWRVMRIAIHPQYQSKGYGSHFLTCIEKSAQKQGVDILGTSFGLNQSLLNYWSKAGWRIIRIGFTQDQASGERSAILLKPLNNSLSAKLFIDDLHEQFCLHFPFYLSDQFKSLSSTLVNDIFASSYSLIQPRHMLKKDLHAIEDFVSNYRVFDVCAYSLTEGLLWYLTSNVLSVSYHDDPQCNENSINVQPLITRLLQKKSIETTCCLHGFTGKKQLNKFIVEQFNLLLTQYKNVIKT